jgi:mannose-6-phosphate isomerase-like protein (cupin superfamily)
MTENLVHDQLFRQRYRFARQGEVLRIDIWSDPGGGVLAEHFHPTLEERYEVLEGELTVHVDGRAQVLGPGERAVVPPRCQAPFREHGKPRVAYPGRGRAGGAAAGVNRGRSGAGPPRRHQCRR